MRTKPEIPCTGRVSTDGFAAFVGGELGESRRNLRLLEGELRQTLKARAGVLIDPKVYAGLYFISKNR